jgi:hypothetical protein
VDRCALFVDASYVLSEGAMAVHGTRQRTSVSWDYAGLVKLLGGLARDRTGMPLLRCYWYEPVGDAQLAAEHEALADTPGLKLRLARTRPGRREGVLSDIHRDLSTLARNNAVRDAVIASAADDLAEVVAEVQDLGIRVILLHIAAGRDWSIPRAVRQECDEVVDLAAAHLRPFVELITGAEPSDHLGRQVVPEQQLDGGYGRQAVANGRGAPVTGAGLQALPAPSHASMSPVMYGAAEVEYQTASRQPAAHAALPAGVPMPAPVAAQHAAPQQPAPPQQAMAQGGAPMPANTVQASPAHTVSAGLAQVAGQHGAPVQAAAQQPGPLHAAQLPPSQPAAAQSHAPAVGSTIVGNPVLGNTGTGNPLAGGPAPVQGVPVYPAAAQQQAGQVHGQNWNAPQGPDHGQRQGYGGGAQEPVQRTPTQAQRQPGMPAADHDSPRLVGPSAEYGDAVTTRYGGPPRYAESRFVDGPVRFADAPSRGADGDGIGYANGSYGGGNGAGYANGGYPNGAGHGGYANGAGRGGYTDVSIPTRSGGQGGGQTRANWYPDDGRSDSSTSARFGDGGVHYPQPPRGGYGADAGHPSDPRYGGQDRGVPGYQQPDHGGYGGSQLPAVPDPQPMSVSLAEAVQAAHAEGFGFGEAVARDAPALWLEAVLARKPRMPSDLEARLLQGSSLPIDSLLHDEVRHSLRRGFWDALERSRR